MTILVALQADDGVWIGSDTSQFAGDQRVMQPYVKWHMAGPWAIGVPGPGIVAILLAQRLIKESPAPGLDDLAPAWRETMTEFKASNDRTGVKHDGDMAAFIAHGALGVFHLDPHGYLSRHTDPPWYAMGSGGSEARGALHALWGRREMTGAGIVECAIEAACALDAYCHGSWIKRLEP